jgi:uncharacterized protein YbaR (Trm112 family)
MKQWQAGLVLQVWWHEGLAVEVRGEPAPADFAHAEEATPAAEVPAAAPGMIARLDASYGRWLRRRSQSRARDLTRLLACPVSDCHGDLSAAGDGFDCARCGRRYPMRGTVPVLLPEAAQ